MNAADGQEPAPASSASSDQGFSTEGFDSYSEPSPDDSEFQVPDNHQQEPPVTRADAEAYMDLVRSCEQPHAYDDLSAILGNLRSGNITIPQCIQLVANLFGLQPELIVGFNTFLPVGYKIHLSDDGQVNVSTPDGDLAFDLPDLPVAPKSDARFSPECDFALDYVNKIRKRYEHRPDVYNDFLDIVQMHLTDGKCREPANTCPLDAIRKEVTALFKDHNDLVLELEPFLPEADGQLRTKLSIGFDKAIKLVTYARDSPEPSQPEAIDSSEESLAEQKHLSAPEKESIYPIPPEDDKPEEAYEHLCKILEALHTSGAENRELFRNFVASQNNAASGVNVDHRLSSFLEKVHRILNSNLAYQSFSACAAQLHRREITRGKFQLLVFPFVQEFPELNRVIKEFIGTTSQAATATIPSGGSTSSPKAVASGKDCYQSNERSTDLVAEWLKLWKEKVEISHGTKGITLSTNAVEFQNELRELLFPEDVFERFSKRAKRCTREEVTESEIRRLMEPFQKQLPNIIKLLRHYNGFEALRPLDEQLTAGRNQAPSKPRIDEANEQAPKPAGRKRFSLPFLMLSPLTDDFRYESPMKRSKKSNNLTTIEDTEDHNVSGNAAVLQKASQLLGATEAYVTFVQAFVRFADKRVSETEFVNLLKPLVEQFPDLPKLLSEYNVLEFDALAHEAPSCSGGPARSSAEPDKALTQNLPAVKRRRPLMPLQTPAASKENIQANFTATHVPREPMKSSEMDGIRTNDAGKQSAESHALHEKIREVLSTPEEYDNYLGFLDLYKRKQISKSELVRLLTPHLGHHSDLFNSFKDFIQYNDASPPDPQNLKLVKETPHVVPPQAVNPVNDNPKLNSASRSCRPKQAKFSKSKITINKAGRQETLDENMFLGEVYETLPTTAAYEKFLRFVDHYNQKRLSKSKLVDLVAPLLGDFSDLFQWFKEFIEFDDSSATDKTLVGTDSDGPFSTQLDRANKKMQNPKVNEAFLLPPPRASHVTHNRRPNLASANHSTEELPKKGIVDNDSGANHIFTEKELSRGVRDVSPPEACQDPFGFHSLFDRHAVSEPGPVDEAAPLLACVRELNKRLKDHVEFEKFSSFNKTSRGSRGLKSSFRKIIRIDIPFVMTREFEIQKTQTNDLPTSNENPILEKIRSVLHKAWRLVSRCIC